MVIGAIGGMKIGRGNRSTRRNSVPVPICAPQTPQDQTSARTRSAAVGNRRLTAWAMARPSVCGLHERCRDSLIILGVYFFLNYTQWRQACCDSDKCEDCVGNFYEVQVYITPATGNRTLGSYWLAGKGNNFRAVHTMPVFIATVVC
jgi:hypothetical protein